MTTTALRVHDLRVTAASPDGPSYPVDGVSLHVGQGEILGIAGESGSGKSLTLKAILGLLPPGLTATGTLQLASGDGELAPYQSHQVRGAGVGMVFQEPMTALNPTMRAGDLVALAARLHGRLSRRASRHRAVELLRQVGVPDAERRAKAWPHQLSGGLRQRVMIAAALAAQPRVLLCDEPTTALDVTVQHQILRLLRWLADEHGTGMIFVSHDLPVIAQLCDRIAVMYAGRFVETGYTRDVLTHPRHPYTAALLRAAPSVDQRGEQLAGISGQPPDARAFPAGCRFRPRCPLARDDCAHAPYEIQPVAAEHGSACIHHADLEVRTA
ncbi:ABC transporter ATP-binding protein [Phytoactinopolyspora limicola]|uniref:ABC transporter ATP-binding protein n=1 Tax=Phytoactinopolyspora limicola TaxID=2715536 RepID=UPI00140A1B7D|nr:ABC transporter ATP-binding protein [Phytoactinopolyspora limicola]